MRSTISIPAGRRSRRRPRRSLAVLSVVAVVGVAGCGGSDPTDATDGLLEQSREFQQQGQELQRRTDAIREKMASGELSTEEGLRRIAKAQRRFEEQASAFADDGRERAADVLDEAVENDALPDETRTHLEQAQRELEEQRP